MDNLNVGQLIKNPKHWYTSCTGALEAAVEGLRAVDVDATGRLEAKDFDYLLKRHENANDPTVRAMRRSQNDYRKWLEEQKKPAEQATLAVNRLRIAQETVLRLVHYQPGNLVVDNVAEMLKELFDVHLRLFDNLSKVPEAARDVQRLKGVAEAMIRTASELSMHTAGSDLKKLIDSFKIKPNDKAVLSLTAVEYGAYSQIVATDIAAQAVANARIASFDEYMTTLGLTPEQQAALKAAATIVHKSFDDVRLMAKAFGSYVPRLENTPFNPRVYTVEAMLQDVMGTSLGDLQDVKMSTVRAGTGERKMFWYLPKDVVSFLVALGLVPPGGSGRPSPHLLAPVVDAVMDIPIKQQAKKGVPVADAYTIPRETKATFLNKNNDVTFLSETSKADVEAKLVSEGVVLTKKEIDKISAAYLPEEVNPVLDALGKDYIVIDADTVYVRNTASPDFNSPYANSFNPSQPGLHRTTDLVTTFLATQGRSGIDGRKVLYSGGQPSGLFATGNDALVNVKKVLNAELANLPAPRKRELYFTMSKNSAVVYDSGSRTFVLTSPGFDVNTFTTSAQYKWFTGRATELQDSAGTFQSKFIKDYDQVEIVKAKGKQTAKEALLTRLRSEVDKSTNISLAQKTEYRIQLKGDISNERLSAIAEEIADTMNKKAFLIEHSDTGKYEVLAFADDVVEDYDATLINDFISNPLALLEFIKGGIDESGKRTVGRLTDSQLERLVDSGILTKVPMTNIEVWAYIRAKFALPGYSPQDMISADLHTVMQRYTESLTKASSISFIYTTLAEQGLEAGWLIDSTKQAYPTNWVKFSDVPNFAQDLVKQGRAELAGELKNYYVDPLIAKYITTVTKVIGDPVYTGYLAKFWHDVTSTMTSTMLAFGSVAPGASYIAMNSITDWFTSTGAGSNPYTQTFSLTEILKSLVKKPEEIFDNTVPFVLDADTALPLTKLELYQQFMNKYNRGVAAGTASVGVSPSTGTGGGTLGEIVSSMAGSAKDAIGYGTRDIWNILRYAFAKSKSETGARRVTAVTNMIAKIARGVLTPAINTASIVQRGLMWNLYKSLHIPASRGVLNSHAVKRATSFGFFNGYPTSSAGVYDVMSTAFVFGENAGKVARSLDKNNIMNFAPYIIKTPFNVLNQLMANPVPFFNYLRLLQFSETFKQDQDGVTQAEMYYQGGTYIGSIADPNEPDNEDKRAGVMLYNNYNPYATFLGLGRQGLRFMTGEPEDMADFVDQQMMSETEKFWTDIRATVYTNLGFLPKLAGAIAFGLDYEGSPLRDKEAGAVDTFYGYGMPPRVVKVLRMIPFFGAIDKYNFGGRFGQAEVRDPWSLEVEQPMIAGRTETGQERLARYGNTSMRILQFIGFDYSIQPFDEHEVRSIQALNRALKEQTDKFNDVRDTLNEAALKQGSLTEQQMEAKRETLKETVDTYLVLYALKAQYDGYAYERKLTPPDIQANEEKRRKALLYAGNGDAYVKDELERVTAEVEAVYQQLSEYGSTEGQ